MAVRVIARVWDGFPGGGSELLALLALADWSDDDGRCWPSMASIARKIRLSPDQARRVVHKLIDGNFVRVTAGNGGGRISRRYQINLDALSPGSDATPGVDVRADVTASPPLASLSGLALQSCASRTVMDTSRDPQETQNLLTKVLRRPAPPVTTVLTRPSSVCITSCCRWRDGCVNGLLSGKGLCGLGGAKELSASHLIGGHDSLNTSPKVISFVGA